MADLDEFCAVYVKKAECSAWHDNMVVEMQCNTVLFFVHLRNSSLLFCAKKPYCSIQFNFIYIHFIYTFNNIHFHNVLLKSRYIYFWLHVKSELYFQLPAHFVFFFCLLLFLLRVSNPVFSFTYHLSFTVYSYIGCSCIGISLKTLKEYVYDLQLMLSYMYLHILCMWLYMYRSLFIYI